MGKGVVQRCAGTAAVYEDGEEVEGCRGCGVGDLGENEECATEEEVRYDRCSTELLSASWVMGTCKRKLTARSSPHV